MSPINQKTLKEEITLKGIGLHNGIIANLVIKPADENFGINFCRVDIYKDKLIKANFKNVVEPILCTKIQNKWNYSIYCRTFNGSFFGEGIDNHESRPMHLRYQY